MTDKFCVNCKHCRRQPVTGFACVAFNQNPERNLVTGAIVCHSVPNCVPVRKPLTFLARLFGDSTYGKCGPDGRLYEKREESIQLESLLPTPKPPVRKP